jgi:hypothetical protein
MSFVLQPWQLLVVILTGWLSRRVQLAGCTRNPNESWMKQMGRNLTDPLVGSLRNRRYLLMDRDSTYSEAFRHLREQAAVHCVRLPARSPNLTPHIERFMRTIKDECLHRMIFFGEPSLQTAVLEFLVHYHRERDHQGMANRIMKPGKEVGRTTGSIRGRQRLGGILRYYHRKAA